MVTTLLLKTMVNLRDQARYRDENTNHLICIDDYGIPSNKL